MSTYSEMIFPDYVMERELKAGKRGNVWIVRHKDTKIRYVYRAFEGNGEVYRKLMEVSSPYLPQICEVREQDGRVFVLEEYVSGDTLAFLLEKKPLPLNFAKEIAVQICSALDVLHRHDVVHRDVKPGNIIIRGDQAVLIDFDTSRVVKPENHSDTQVMGTTGYAAPEQYGFSQTDARADIYAMGILINEMLTNQHPSKLLTGGPLRPVIEKCIEVNVDKRYASVKELQAAICGSNKTRKHRTAVAILAAVLAICVAAPFFGGRTEEKTDWNMEITQEVWPGDQQLYQMPFQYDLDGDGESEEYLFGIFNEDIPREFAWTLSDQFWLGGAPNVQRNVAPAVWKQYDDGSWELVEDFAPLLEDAQIRVWRGSEQNGSAPEVYDREGAWSGSLRLVFGPDCLGVWLYELSATVDGQDLTALCRSNMIEG